MPRPRAHAPNKQGGKPAGQDTSSYIKQGEVKKLIFENDAFRNRISDKRRISEPKTQLKN